MHPGKSAALPLVSILLVVPGVLADGTGVDRTVVDFYVPDCAPGLGSFRIDYRPPRPLPIDPTTCTAVVSSFSPCGPGPVGTMWMRFLSPSEARVDYELRAPENDCVPCLAFDDVRAYSTVATAAVTWEHVRRRYR